ncbi:MAG: arylesterase [Acidobacteria bacterium]|nr:MAG: arylesterase [Acidobacteriota bacterium]
MTDASRASKVVAGPGIILLALVASAPGCRPSTSSSPAPPPSAAAGRTALPRVVAPDAPAVVFLGDSLTAGYGLDPDQAYPALIQTSAGARRRIEWLLAQPVAVLVVETGGNDGLRGQDPAATADNIQAIINRARRPPSPAKVVLVGMEALPNYGAEYGRRFRDIYPRLARKNGVALVPFLLEGVGGVAALNQADGIHPTAEGQRRLAETVWKTLQPLLTG